MSSPRPRARQWRTDIANMRAGEAQALRLGGKAGSAILRPLINCCARAGKFGPKLRHQPRRAQKVAHARIGVAVARTTSAVAQAQAGAKAWNAVGGNDHGSG